MNIRYTALFALAFLISCAPKSKEQGSILEPFPGGVPQIAEHDFIQLAKIEKITRLRSGIGRDISNGNEACCNMTNMYLPYAESRKPEEVEIYSPIDGKIEAVTEIVENERTALEITIRSDDLPSIVVKIAPLALLSSDFEAGKIVKAGMQLGYLSLTERQNPAAITVMVDTGQYLSFAELMADNVFENYAYRGVKSRDEFIITKAERDADPLQCNNGVITAEGRIENWVYLQ